MTSANTDGAAATTSGGTFSLEPRFGGQATLRLSGTWQIGSRFPSFADLRASLAAQPGIRGLDFETGALSTWDSGFLTVVLNLLQHCRQAGIDVAVDGLPSGAQKLLHLATAVPERQGARRTASSEPFLVRVGKETMKTWRSAGEMSAFLGEACIAFARLLRGKARFRLVDLALIIQECGANALPIVTLISVLIGLILAFVGAIQLRQFGAQIYVADLVAIAMAREMGAIMTAIIMAGRTGAAFAAQLGTMQVNEEIDAFSTLGFSPMEFLVLPRMLALILMMPLLCVYADVLGILGGAIVGIGLLGITPTEYYIQTVNGVALDDFAVGIFKSAIFGVVVAFSGCLRGIQSGRSASAVGEAATSAVVMAIVLIIVLDGIFAVVTDTLGI
jgi:phospholipid/cholesterol/gamma-HCH transport system permease protein